MRTNEKQKQNSNDFSCEWWEFVNSELPVKCSDRVNHSISIRVPMSGTTDGVVLPSEKHTFVA